MVAKMIAIIIQLLILMTGITDTKHKQMWISEVERVTEGRRERVGNVVIWNVVIVIVSGT
jgi:hypothetical protein